MEGGRFYRLAWIFYLLLAVGGVVWVGWSGGAIPTGLFFDASGWWVDLALGLAAGAALLGAWGGLRRLSRRARELERRIAEVLGPLEAGEMLALAAISGFAEELFFRGAMQTAWGWLPAVAVFTLLHTGPGPAFRIWTAFAAVAGLTFAGLMAWRENLLAPVVAHGLVNAVNLGRLAAARRAAPPSAGAGGDGPEGMC